jgi:hypothetical protein
MKFIDYLNEEYVGRPGIGPYEVFVNPAPKEMRTHKSVRFIADNLTKRFFITYFLFLHEYLVAYLRQEDLLGNTNQCFMGMGTIEMAHINFDDFSYDWGQPPDEEMKKFEWTKKYFTNDSIKRLWK